MNTNSFLYYGYDKNTFKECREQIRWSNMRNMLFLNTWFLLITFIFTAVRIYDGMAMFSIFMKFNMNGFDRMKVWIFVLFLLLAVVVEVLVVIFRKHTQWKSRAVMYPGMLLMMAFGIFISMAQPYKPAIMFHVFLVLLSVIYMDNVLTMICVFIFSAGMLLLSSVKGFPALGLAAKAGTIAFEDLFNSILFLAFSLILHYTIQRTKMQQYVTFLKNVQMTRELEVQSSFDALTSLLNRGRFFSIAGEVMRNRDKDEYIVICLLDLDGFKQINDKLGHQMGDKAIQVAGTTLIDAFSIDLTEKWSFPERAIREKLSFAGRLGGDEFIALIRGEKDESAVRMYMQNMLTALNSVELDQLHGLHASVGVTELKPEDRDIDKAYSRADEALYTSKRSGKNMVTFG